MSNDEKPLPPGSTGWPVLGETLTFLKDEFHFVESRNEKHGPVFRSKILGRDTVFLSGPAGATKFNDEADVMRSGGMPPHVEQFFGGRSLPLLDDEEHRTRKALVMAAFSRDALTSYVPAMQSRVETYLAKWAGKTIRASEEGKRLALEVIAKTMMSLDPGADLEKVLENFATLAKGFAGLPIPLPGTTFSNALAARDQIFDVLQRSVKSHREKPQNDGLGRVLAAKTKSGEAITDEAAALELHHFNIAGYLVFTMFVTMLKELDAHPDVRARMRKEIADKGATGSLTIELLDSMPYLNQVVKEVKRTTPFVPVFFGKARRDFEHGGFKIPAGWMVLWGHHATNNAKDAFAEPAKFDPDRFDEERREDEKTKNAFVPQGVGPLLTSHKCAGFDYATIFMQVFAVALVRGYDWEVPKEQSLDIDYGIVPPEYPDGLEVVLKPRK